MPATAREAGADAQETDDGMIKLSELIEQRKSFVPSNEDDLFVFGVEVDTDDVIPPLHVREIGLLARTRDGSLEDDVLDAAISYHLAGIDTILEFPHEVEFRDARHLVATAANSNASLSFLPPDDLSDESFDAYCLKLESVTRAYMAQQTMTRFVMPVTNYLQYMFVEVLDEEKAKSFVPEDSYVIKRFHSVMPLERSDALKARIRAVFHEECGGEEGFRQFALGIMGAVASSVEASLEETRDRLRPAAGSHWLLDTTSGEFAVGLFDRDDLSWRVLQQSNGHTLSDADAARVYRFIESVEPAPSKAGYRVLRRSDSYHLLQAEDGSQVPAWFDGLSRHWTVATSTGFDIVTDEEVNASFSSLGPVHEPSRS